MKAVGLIPNLKKDKTGEITRRLYHYFKEKSIELLLTPECTCLINEHHDGISKDTMAQSADIIVTLGGDGTILKVAREYAPYNVPILGVNLGKKGFLAEIEVEELKEYLDNLIAGRYTIEERMMLDAKVVRHGQEISKFSALNDVVIAKGPFSRIVEIETSVNGNLLETYPGDGLIISTPTGSTGYSFSAGGPVISSNMDLTIITPICPHLMHNRSVIISPDEVVKAQLKTDYSEVVLTVDGQQGFTLQVEDEILIYRSNYRAKLLKLRDRSFFKLLHDKFARK